MEPFLGQISMFAGNFAPRGWAFCDGQLLSINQNQALFSILGTTYGGDGRTTFGLPDLRGRVPMHAGNGPGLTPRPLGQKSGTETNTLGVWQMPAHNHVIEGSVSVEVNFDDATTNEGSGATLGAGSDIYNYAAPEAGEAINGVKSTLAVANTGGNQPINNLQPYQTVNYIIALTGLFPSIG
jgi:microcystin-dependent protein